MLNSAVRGRQVRYPDHFTDTEHYGGYSGADFDHANTFEANYPNLPTSAYSVMRLSPCQ